jgi:hypothetical protein
LEFGSASSADVTFLDGTGTLLLDNAAASASRFSGTITGFAPGTDHIDLGAINSATARLSFTENATDSGGVLSVSDGSHAANIALLGNYMAGSFVTASDGHGGTLISNDPLTAQQASLAHPNT